MVSHTRGIRDVLDVVIDTSTSQEYVPSLSYGYIVSSVREVKDVARESF